MQITSAFVREVFSRTVEIVAPKYHETQYHRSDHFTRGAPQGFVNKHGRRRATEAAWKVCTGAFGSGADGGCMVAASASAAPGKERRGAPARCLRAEVDEACAGRKYRRALRRMATMGIIEPSRLPARRSDGTPDPEVHRKVALAEGGEDTIESAFAL